MFPLGITSLRALRQSKALPLSRLSQRSGLSQTTIAFLERGATPSPDQLIALARGLDLEPGALAIVLATGTLVPASGADADVPR